MFSYFESSVDGIIPNEYSTLEDICSEIFGCIAAARESTMLTARRFWLAKQQLVTPEISKFFNFTAATDSTSPLDLLHSEKRSEQKDLTTKRENIASTAAVSDPNLLQPSNSFINSKIMLNNLNNLNKQYRDNEKTLLITNNEIHADIVKIVDGYANKFIDDAKSQPITKKNN